MNNKGKRFLAALALLVMAFCLIGIGIGETQTTDAAEPDGSAENPYLWNTANSVSTDGSTYDKSLADILNTQSSNTLAIYLKEGYYNVTVDRNNYIGSGLVFMKPFTLQGVSEGETIKTIIYSDFANSAGANRVAGGYTANELIAVMEGATTASISNVKLMPIVYYSNKYNNDILKDVSDKGVKWFTPNVTITTWNASLNMTNVEVIAPNESLMKQPSHTTTGTNWTTAKVYCMGDAGNVQAMKNATWNLNNVTTYGGFGLDKCNVTLTMNHVTMNFGGEDLGDARTMKFKLNDGQVTFSGTQKITINLAEATGHSKSSVAAELSGKLLSTKCPDLSSGTEIHISANTELSSNVVIPNGVKLYIDGTASVSLTGSTFTINEGAEVIIASEASLTVGSTAQIINSGTITNNGTITLNGSNKVVFNNTGGTITGPSASKGTIEFRGESTWDEYNKGYMCISSGTLSNQIIKNYLTAGVKSGTTKYAQIAPVVVGAADGTAITGNITISGNDFQMVSDEHQYFVKLAGVDNGNSRTAPVNKCLVTVSSNTFTCAAANQMASCIQVGWANDAALLDNVTISISQNDYSYINGYEGELAAELDYSKTAVKIIVATTIGPSLSDSRVKIAIADTKNMVGFVKTKSDSKTCTIVGDMEFEYLGARAKDATNTFQINIGDGTAGTSITTKDFKIAGSVTIEISSQATLDNNGTILSLGKISNTGTLDSSGGVIELLEGSSFEGAGTFTIPSIVVYDNSSLIAAAAVISANGTISLGDSITLSGIAYLSETINLDLCGYDLTITGQLWSGFTGNEVKTEEVKTLTITDSGHKDENDDTINGRIVLTTSGTIYVNGTIKVEDVDAQIGADTDSTISYNPQETVTRLQNMIGLTGNSGTTRLWEGTISFDDGSTLVDNIGAFLTIGSESSLMLLSEGADIEFSFPGDYTTPGFWIRADISGHVTIGADIPSFASYSIQYLKDYIEINAESSSQLNIDEGVSVYAAVVLESSATLILSENASLDIGADANLSIAEGATVTIGTDASVVDEGPINNLGTITNNGYMSVSGTLATSGTITNSGIMKILGTVKMSGDGTFMNENGSAISADVSSFMSSEIGKQVTLKRGAVWYNEAGDTMIIGTASDDDAIFQWAGTGSYLTFELASGHLLTTLTGSITLVDAFVVEDNNVLAVADSSTLTVKGTLNITAEGAISLGTGTTEVVVAKGGIVIDNSNSTVTPGQVRIEGHITGSEAQIQQWVGSSEDVEVITSETKGVTDNVSTESQAILNTTDVSSGVSTLTVKVTPDADTSDEKATITFPAGTTIPANTLIAVAPVDDTVSEAAITYEVKFEGVTFANDTPVSITVPVTIPTGAGVSVYYIDGTNRIPMTVTGSTGSNVTFETTHNSEYAVVLTYTATFLYNEDQVAVAIIDKVDNSTTVLIRPVAGYVVSSVTGADEDTKVRYLGDYLYSVTISGDDTITITSAANPDKDVSVSVRGTSTSGFIVTVKSDDGQYLDGTARLYYTYSTTATVNSESVTVFVTQKADVGTVAVSDKKVQYTGVIASTQSTVVSAFAVFEYSITVGETEYTVYETSPVIIVPRVTAS